MNKNLTILLLIILIASAFKLLFIYLYYSTDFDVHRNWLAITSSLPLYQWYFNDVSQWTLDYPPFFAYFEYILSYFAKFFDPDMLIIENVTHSTYNTILFQRLSVIITDIFLPIISSICLTKTIDIKIASIILFSSSLIIIDHMHFQYNSYILLYLFLSIKKFYDRKFIQCFLFFSILILTKHLFLPLVPIFGIILLRYHILLNNNNQYNSINKIIILLLFYITMALFILFIAFFPFIYSNSLFLYQQSNNIPSSKLHLVFLSSFFSSPLEIINKFIYPSILNQFPQIFSRLFPFGRGLVHAYWAPNIWALYLALDKFLVLIYKYMEAKSFVTFCHFSKNKFFICTLYNYLKFHYNTFIQSSENILSSSSGIVGDYALIFLPKIEPIHSFLLVLFIGVIPTTFALLFKKFPGSPTSLEEKNLIYTKQAVHLTRGVIFVTFTTFLFGYHVHEKAILIPLLLQALLINYSSLDKALFFILSLTSSVSFFPLIFGEFEYIIKGNTFYK